MQDEIKEARTISEEVCDVVDSAVAHALLKDIRRRMTPQPLKIRADVELTCFAYNGILHIQNAMRAAELVSTDQCKVKMSLVASPLYVLTSQTSDKDEGITVIDRAVSVLQVLLHFYFFLASQRCVGAY